MEEGVQLPEKNDSVFTETTRIVPVNNEERIIIKTCEGIATSRIRREKIMFRTWHREWHYAINDIMSLVEFNVGFDNDSERRRLLGYLYTSSAQVKMCNGMYRKTRCHDLHSSNRVYTTNPLKYGQNFHGFILEHCFNQEYPFFANLDHQIQDYTSHFFMSRWSTA